MEIINMSYQEFCKLRPYQLNSTINHTEANFFHDPTNERRLIKAYQNADDEAWALNKLKALKNLIHFTSEHDIPEILRPEGIILVNRKFKASIIPLLPGYNSSLFLSSKETPTKVKIEILKQIGTILERIHLADKNAAYGDVHADNFLVSGVNLENKKDMSSIRTFGIDTESMKMFDSPGITNFYLFNNHNISGLDKYQSNSFGIVKADYNSDIFCFIMMILSVISNSDEFFLIGLDEFKMYIDYLDKLGFDSKLLSSLVSIYDKDKDNINPLPHLHTIKKIPKNASLSSFRMH